MAQQTEINHLYLGVSKADVSNPCQVFRTRDQIKGKAEYKDYDPKIHNHLHWGQMKLLLSEIEFLTIALERFGRDSKIKFIYPGAAPGNHTKLLSDMFPQVTFYLYDTVKFVCKESPRIKIYNRYFLDSDMKKWAEEKHDQPILLCSDIRTTPVNTKTILENNALQLKWWRAIQPDLAMFKFRLPYTKGSLKFPEGKIYIQAFPKEMSTECRLIVEKNAKMTEYDYEEHEQIMAYHNQFLRGRFYDVFGDRTVFDIQTHSICNCYDCSVFVQIIIKYNALSGWCYDTLEEYILEEVKRIQNHCAKGVNLWLLTKVLRQK